MKKNYLLPLSAICLLTVVFSSCVKDPLQQSIGDACNHLLTLHTHPVAAVQKGSQIDLSVDYAENATYYWSGPNYYQSYSQNNTVTYDADFSDRGWYYVKISNIDCSNYGFDSVFVDVKFPQGTPACSPTDNSANFTSAVLLGDQSYYYVSFGPGVAGYGITGNSSNGDMNITMSSYWNTNDLEDGVYYTTGSPLPERIDQIHMSNVNQSIWWNAEADKPVYISHAGGKRRITFCGIDFSGDWGGTLYHATVDAQITEP
ncbi:MAG: hypothetical protein ABIN36_11795 [Ferruginibacter sp.]